MLGSVNIKSILKKLWHAPDTLRILDPLPLVHRRGLVIAALAVIIGFLLPSTDDTPTAPVSRDAQLNLQSQSAPQPIQAHFVSSNNAPAQMSPEQVEVIQEEQPTEPEASAPVQTQPYQEISNNGWHSYRIQSGQTMAQLFRDHNLPPTDVYAMAQVEGAGKPLSTLKNGQQIQVRQDENGVVTGLTIETDNGQVLFTRQVDGSFIRAR